MSREQADQIALAVDSPGWRSDTATNKPKFPLPYGDRAPSYKPAKFTPGPDPRFSVEAIDDGKEARDAMWPYYLAGLFVACGVVFAAVALYWRG